MLRMRRAQAGQSASAQVAARESGVTLSPLSLALLASLHRDGPARIKELVSRLGSELTQVSREVSALAGSGHVIRLPDASDGRAVVVEVTAYGTEQWTAYRTAALALVGQVVADWKDTDVAAFAALFDRFLRGMPYAAREK